MNKQFIIKKSDEIAYIVKTGKKSVSEFFIIYNIESNKDYNQYCISVSKKLGKAHIRNKIKRRVKDILMKNRIDLSKKCVIIIRKEAVEASYEDLKEILIKQIKGDK